MYHHVTSLFPNSSHHIPRYWNRSGIDPFPTSAAKHLPPYRQLYLQGQMQGQIWVDVGIDLGRCMCRDRSGQMCLQGQIYLYLLPYRYMETDLEVQQVLQIIQNPTKPLDYPTYHRCCKTWCTVPTSPTPPNPSTSTSDGWNPSRKSSSNRETRNGRWASTSRPCVIGILQLWKSHRWVVWESSG